MSALPTADSTDGGVGVSVGGGVGVVGVGVDGVGGGTYNTLPLRAFPSYSEVNCVWEHGVRHSTDLCTLTHMYIHVHCLKGHYRPTHNPPTA